MIANSAKRGSGMRLVTSWQAPSAHGDRRARASARRYYSSWSPRFVAPRRWAAGMVVLRRKSIFSAGIHHVNDEIQHAND